MALLLAAMCLTLASVARAAPFELEWSAPPGCPSRERMLAATRTRLGESETSAPPELFVRGTVTIEGPNVVVDLQVKDSGGVDRGERQVRFEDRTCEAIEAPTALVLAMMLGVAQPRETEPAPAASAAPLEPTAPRLPSAEPKPAVVPSAQAPITSSHAPPMSVGVSAVTSLGLLPNLGVGAALRWTVMLWSAVVLGIEGSFETTWAVRAASGDATFRQFDGGALLGVRMARSPGLEIVPLLEGRGGILTGNVTGLRSAYDATSVVGSIGAGVLGRVAIGPTLRFDILPTLRVPLARDVFQVREDSELIHVHRPAPVEARLSLGIAWELH